MVRTCQRLHTGIFLPAILASRRERASAPRGVRALGEARKEATCTTQEILAAANFSRPSHYARPHTHTRRPPSANVNVKFQSTARTTRGKAQAAMRGHIGVTAVGASHEERLGHLPLPIYVAHVGDGASPCRRCASPKPPCAAAGSRVSESRSARSRHGGSDAQRVRIGQGRGRLRMRGCSPPGQRRRQGSLWRQKPVARAPASSLRDEPAAHDARGVRLARVSWDVGGAPKACGARSPGR